MGKIKPQGVSKEKEGVRAKTVGSETGDRGELIPHFLFAGSVVLGNQVDLFELIFPIC
jgi:hypothetical protein